MLIGDDPNTLLPTLLDVESKFSGQLLQPANRAVRQVHLNPCTLQASQPNAMVLRYSRRDREMLQVPE
jgi:hypothetical protein